MEYCGPNKELFTYITLYDNIVQIYNYSASKNNCNNQEAEITSCYQLTGSRNRRLTNHVYHTLLIAIVRNEMICYETFC